MAENEEYSDKFFKFLKTLILRFANINWQAVTRVTASTHKKQGQSNLNMSYIIKIFKLFLDLNVSR